MLKNSSEALRRRLLSGAAFLAATVLTMSAAAEEPIKLGVEGYFSIFFAFVSEQDGPGEPGAGLRNHGIAREGEVHFRGRTTLDNGMKVGVNVQLEAETCIDQIDESYIFISGEFGRLNLGSEDGAPDLMHYGPPTALPRHGYDDPAQGYILAGANLAGPPATTPGITGDSEKITYFTPRFGGVQLGASYTPDTCEASFGDGVAPCGGSFSGFQSTATVGQQSEVVGIGANFERAFADVTFALSGAYSFGDLEVPAAGATDQKQWAVGTNVTFGGFTIGAAFRHDNQGLSGDNSDRRDMSIGALYATRLWQISLGAAWAVAEEGPGAGEDKSRIVELAASYELGPGVTLAAGVISYHYEDNLNAPADENDGIAFTIGTLLRF